MIIKYVFLAVCGILLQILHVLHSPLLMLFLNKDGYLPKIFSWFQTEDAPAIGDQMFADREMAWTKKYPTWLSNYLRGLFWAIRNPAYGYMAAYGITVDKITDYKSSGPEIDIGDGGYTLGEVTRTCKNNGVKYFDFKKAGKWNSNYGWMIQFGWSLNNIETATKGTNRRLCIDVRPRISLKVGGETSL